MIGLLSGVIFPLSLFFSEVVSLLFMFFVLSVLAYFLWKPLSADFYVICLFSRAFQLQQSKPCFPTLSSVQFQLQLKALPPFQWHSSRPCAPFFLHVNGITQDYQCVGLDDTILVLRGLQLTFVKCLWRNWCIILLLAFKDTKMMFRMKFAFNCLFKPKTKDAKNFC